MSYRKQYYVHANLFSQLITDFLRTLTLVLLEFLTIVRKHSHSCIMEKIIWKKKMWFICRFIWQCFCNAAIRDSVWVSHGKEQRNVSNNWYESDRNSHTAAYGWEKADSKGHTQVFEFSQRTEHLSLAERAEYADDRQPLCLISIIWAPYGF